MKKVCVLLADGFEEVEGLTPIDYLRRAGFEVRVAGVTGKDVAGGHDIRVDTDITVDELDEDFDAIVVPGGGQGSRNLAADPDAVALIKRHFAAGKLVAAICAAPVVVLHAACGVLAGRRFTCFPGLEKDAPGAIFSEGRVVVDSNLITARAAGCAGEFSRAVVEALAGPEAARKLAETVLL